MDINETEEWAKLAIKMDNLSDHEYIRKHILEYKGVPDKVERVSLDHERLVISTQMKRVFDRCLNRLLMGRFRYGSNQDMTFFNAEETMKGKLKQYSDTHNTEHLLDLINYAYLEIKFGTHPDKHFKAIDDGVHMNDKYRR